jgi:hypothetical protein
LNAVDPQLESARIQPLSLPLEPISEKPVPKFCFHEMETLCRYGLGLRSRQYDAFDELGFVTTVGLCTLESS